MAILKVQGLVKTYRDVRALDNVSFEFESGILSFLGPSGCGKTTLLRSIAGLEVPEAGSISIAGKVQTSIEQGILVPPYSRAIGFVFQNYALWPHMTVYRNVTFGLKLRKLPEEEIRRRALSALELVGLKGKEERYPSQLSGGQQQRVALARSLALEPRLILLDEPLSNLDAKLREEMRGELRKLIKKVGISALYVTHDQEEAFTISDAVIVMESGRILQYAAPDEIYNHPAHPFVASFIGHSALLDGRVVRVEGERWFVNVPDFDKVLVCSGTGSVPAGAACKVVIRTSEIRLSNERFPDGTDNVLEGQMLSRQFRGGLTDHFIQVGRRELVVTSHRHCPMVRLNGQSGKTYLSIDRSAISVITEPAGPADG
ncbi:MAG TPA: ABC transporter ATP-binding protein [candidate division Zixibacteria bacterium]|nr:ABC transporter ATP-binding protein [candidate division Zixibacteria bacterium]